GVAKFYDALADRTGWSRDDIEFLASSDCFSLSYPAAFLNERALVRLRDVFDVASRVGASAKQLKNWTLVDASLPEDQGSLPNAADIALDVKRVVRAKYDDAGWADVARPLRDVLREKQRAALVGYLISQGNLESPDELFARLLIDVEMSACQLTS